MTAIPIAPIRDGVLAVPLVGAVDGNRVQLLTHKLLEAITQARCQYVILDIAGVPSFYTSTAQHIMASAKSVRLLGSTGSSVLSRPWCHHSPPPPHRTSLLAL